ncbi:LOW QUALITY PROTEIN: conserved hypothetical protein, partial [Streptomyces griseoflavus Tu4000]
EGPGRCPQGRCARPRGVGAPSRTGSSRSPRGCPYATSRPCAGSSPGTVPRSSRTSSSPVPRRPRRRSGPCVGAAAMMPVPPAMPTELAAEITGVAAIELKLIAELHEVYGVRPAGGLSRRSTVYLNSWSEERGVEATRPSTVSAALNTRMKRELRQRIMKRTVRNLPNLMPFLVGAAVGAVMNRRDTTKLATRIRDDLRRIQVPWDALPELPALERPANVLPEDSLPEDALKELGGHPRKGDGRQAP